MCMRLRILQVDTVCILQTCVRHVLWLSYCCACCVQQEVCADRQSAATRHRLTWTGPPAVGGQAQQSSSSSAAAQCKSHGPYRSGLHAHRPSRTERLMNHWIRCIRLSRFAAKRSRRCCGTGVWGPACKACGADHEPTTFPGPKSTSGDSNTACNNAHLVEFDQPAYQAVAY